MDIRDRLKIFIKYEKLSVSGFEKSCGFYNGFVNSIVKNIDDDKLNTILSKFPKLNKYWLLFEEGEMILDQQPNVSNVININRQQGNGNQNTIGNVTNNNSASENEIIKNLSETVKSQQETISNLLKKLLQ